MLCSRTTALAAFIFMFLCFLAIFASDSRSLLSAQVPKITPTLEFNSPEKGRFSLSKAAAVLQLPISQDALEALQPHNRNSNPLSSIMTLFL